MKKIVNINLQDLSYIILFILTIIMMMTSAVVSASPIDHQPSTQIVSVEVDTFWASYYLE